VSVSKVFGAAMVAVAAVAVLAGIAAPPAAPVSACATNWRQCRDNTDLMANHRGVIAIPGACLTAARRESRYGEPAFSGGTFARYFPGDDFARTGIVEAIAPDARVPNQYAAQVLADVVCRYDLAAGQVVSLRFVPR
jgi:hypothetical protein